jgi:hypothetical protein
MKNLFLVLLLMTMCSCTYHSQTEEPITPLTFEAPEYRSANSIGNLRRLALMPIKLHSYKGKYDSEKDQLIAALSYEDRCANFLASDKGYEIVVLRDLDRNCRNGLSKNVECICSQELYQKWQKATAKKKTVPIIQEIGRALNVDGVLVVWKKERRFKLDPMSRGWKATSEAILNLALLNTPLVYNIVTPDIGGMIYETATGRLVWHKERSSMAEQSSTFHGQIFNLFVDLENAVPRQLIK